MALEAASAQLGWRVYATNMPVAQLSGPQLVLAERQEYLVARSLGRRKGQPLARAPLYGAWDEHATGRIRRLALALWVLPLLEWVLPLLEWVVRHRRAHDGAVLPGRHAGHPKRAPARPSTERLRTACRGIMRTMLVAPDQIRRPLTTLSPLQQRILALLDFSPTIYTNLAGDSAQPP